MSALAAIHVAKKQLCLDDDAYRDVLVQVTGKSSAGDMTEAERSRVLSRFREMGFTRSDKAARKALGGQYAKKLQALWIAAWNLGLARDRRDSALVSFVKRQTGLDHVRFLQYPEDAAKAIEALKAWMKRDAGVEWDPGSRAPDWMRRPQYRIALAQFDIVRRARLVDISALTIWMQRHKLGTPATLVDEEWHHVMNTLGELVRQANSQPDRSEEG